MSGTTLWLASVTVTLLAAVVWLVKWIGALSAAAAVSVATERLLTPAWPFGLGSRSVNVSFASSRPAKAVPAADVPW